ARPHERRHLELRRNGDEHALEVAERLDQRLLVLVRDDDERRLLAPAVDELPGLPRGRRLERRAVDEREGLVADVIRERARERGAPNLAVDLELEAAPDGRERDAAAGVVRRADRALARAARALLAPRLGAAARDEPTALRAARARTMRVQLGAHDLVH